MLPQYLQQLDPDDRLIVHDQDVNILGLMTGQRPIDGERFWGTVLVHGLGFCGQLTS
jgi:hypothetical protein